MTNEDTDPGQGCATCGTKIQELSLQTADGRTVCSRTCAVHGVRLPKGTPDAPTTVGPPSASSWAWTPNAWLVGVRWEGLLVHVHAPRVRWTVRRGAFGRALRRPAVWVPLALIAALALGVGIGAYGLRSLPQVIDERSR